MSGCRPRIFVCKKLFAFRMIFELTQIDFDMVGFSQVL